MFWFIAEKHIFLGAKQPANKSNMLKRSRTRSEFIVVTATVQIDVQKVSSQRYLNYLIVVMRGPGGSMTGLCVSVCHRGNAL